MTEVTERGSAPGRTVGNGSVTAADMVPGEWFRRADHDGPMFYQCTHPASGWGSGWLRSSRHLMILASVFGATTDLRVLHTRVLGTTRVVRLDAGEVWVRLNDLVGSRQTLPLEAVVA